MRQIIYILCTGIIVMMYSGCAGTSKGGGSTSDNLGRLNKMANELREKGYIAAVATATDMELQTAIDIATIDARRMMAQTIETKLKDMEKRFIDRTKTQDNQEFLSSYARVTKTVTSQSIKGSVSVETPFTKDEKGDHTVFVLMKIDMIGVNNYLKEQVKTEEILRVKFEEAKMMKELDEETEKLEKQRNR